MCQTTHVVVLTMLWIKEISFISIIAPGQRALLASAGTTNLRGSAIFLTSHQKDAMLRAIIMSISDPDNWRAL